MLCSTQYGEAAVQCGGIFSLLIYSSLCGLGLLQSPEAEVEPSTVSTCVDDQAQPTLQDKATIYFYRKGAITRNPASAFVDDEQVCSVHSQMFCAVEVKRGEHGAAQFSKNASQQEKVTIESGQEYYFSFKPDNVTPWVCALLAGSCEDPGWRLVPPDRGQKEIQDLKREEIVVPPGIFSKGVIGLGDQAHFETIQVSLRDRVDMSIVYSYTNMSESDYVVNYGESATLVEVKASGEWAKNPDYRLKYPVTAPVGKKVLLTLLVSYDYSAALRKGEEPSPQKLASFVKDRTSSLYRFFLFDPSSRMKVNFNAGWKPKSSEVVGHSPEFFTNIGPERKSCFSQLKGLGENGPNGDPGAEAEGWKACLIRNVP